MDKSTPSRRRLLATAAAVAANPAWAQSGDVRLRRDGAERALPARTLGFNTPANNAIPFEDPAYAPAVKAIAPHYLRFPGGTVANYYNWRTGQLDVTDYPDGSIYRKFMIAKMVPATLKAHPNGVFYDRFHAFAEQVGADVVMLPNLETSTEANEAARFQAMAARGLVPSHIEMGNEFYHALVMDPETLKIFPDWKTSLARTHRYLEAIRPSLRKDARIAVQAASSRLHHPDASPPDDPRALKERQWDDAMAPEPWFDAVTAHLYPALSRSAGLKAMADIPGNVGMIYPAMLARADEGYDRSLSDTAARMPGKEIWVTEWGGFETENTLGTSNVKFDGMWLHQVTRSLMSQLRRREVTVSNYHALFARGDMSSVLKVGPGEPKYTPVNSAGVLHWFFAATRGPDAHYQRVRVEGSQRIAAHGTIDGEGFRDVEAALLRQGRRRTLFVHNAWDTPHGLNLGDLVGATTPLIADVVATPDLLKVYHDGVPAVTPLPTQRGVTAPAHSLTRVRWTA